jgi:hypothetical protein
VNVWVVAVRAHRFANAAVSVSTADQVVQRAFGCHPERGGNEPRVEAVGELGEPGLAQ